MTEIALLYLFLCIAFFLAPSMTNRFFLNDSKVYSRAHWAVLITVFAALALEMNMLIVLWPLFCIFGFFLFLKKGDKSLLSMRGIATCVPFLFSLISSLWFFAGVNDLRLLGYDKTWSFYAALHGGFLGWLFVGCVAFLSRRSRFETFHLWGCYLCFIFFLFVAFGINGVPHIKQIGVVGFSIIVPVAIGLYFWGVRRTHSISAIFAALSLASIAISMTLALLNEFWNDLPRFALGVPVMVLVHGLLNAVFAVPCFYFAIRHEYRLRA